MFREGLSAPTLEAPRYETRQPESYHPWPGFRVVPVLLPKDSAKAWFLSGMLHLDLRPVTHVHRRYDYWESCPSPRVVIERRLQGSSYLCHLVLPFSTEGLLSRKGRQIMAPLLGTTTVGHWGTVVELRQHRSNTRLFWHRFGMKQALLRARNDRRPLLRFWGDDQICA